MWIKKSTYNALLKELADNKEAYGKTKFELTEKLSEEKNEVKHLKSDIHSLKNQNEDLKATIENLKGERNQVKFELQKTAEANKNFEKQIEVLKSKKSKKETKK